VTRGGSSGLIPGYLRDRAQVCIYDRTNVGFSDPLPGPLSGNDAVRDLHRLLSAAHIRGPYVLLGRSFGGLIAVMYAATYPEDVSGIVLLDAPLPDDVINIDEPRGRPRPGRYIFTAADPINSTPRPTETKRY
jgi:pimeloyl-ACP methyl ester carboxylesterase